MSTSDLSLYSVCAQHVSNVVMGAPYVVDAQLLEHFKVLHEISVERK